MYGLRAYNKNTHIKLLHMYHLYTTTTDRHNAGHIMCNTCICVSIASCQPNVGQGGRQNNGRRC